MALIIEGSNKKKQTEEDKKKAENAIRAAVASKTTPKAVNSSPDSFGSSSRSGSSSSNYTLPSTSSRSPSKDIISYLPSGKDSTQTAVEHWSKTEKSSHSLTDSTEDKQRAENIVRSIVASAAPQQLAPQVQSPLNAWRAQTNATPPAYALRPETPDLYNSQIQASSSFAPTLPSLVPAPQIPYGPMPKPQPALGPVTKPIPLGRTFGEMAQQIGAIMPPSEPLKVVPMSAPTGPSPWERMADFIQDPTTRASVLNNIAAGALALRGATQPLRDNGVGQIVGQLDADYAQTWGANPWEKPGNTPPLTAIKQAAQEYYKGSVAEKYNQANIQKAMTYLAQKYPSVGIDPTARPGDELKRINAERAALREKGAPTDPLELQDYNQRLDVLGKVRNALGATVVREKAGVGFEAGINYLITPNAEASERLVNLFLPDKAQGAVNRILTDMQVRRLEDAAEKGFVDAQGNPYKPEDVPPLASRIVAGVEGFFTPGWWNAPSYASSPSSQAVLDNIQKVYETQQDVNRAIDAGLPGAEAANYASQGGPEKVQSTLRMLEESSPDNIASMRAQASLLYLSGEPQAAAELWAQSDILEKRSVADIIDSNVPFWWALGFGVFGDMFNLADPFIPGPAALRRARREWQATGLLIDEAAGNPSRVFAKLVGKNANAVDDALRILSDAQEVAAAEKYGAYNLVKKGKQAAPRTTDVRTFWQKVNPFASTPGSMARTDAQHALEAVMDLTRGAQDAQDIKGLVHTLAESPETVIDALGVLKFGTKEQAQAHKLVRLLGDNIDSFVSLNKKGGKVDANQFLREAQAFLDANAPRFYRSDSKLFKGLRATRHAAETPFRLQKELLANTWLIFRPGNWLRNAAGATTMMTASDAFSLRSADNLLDTMLSMGVTPTRTMLEYMEGATSAAGKEFGGSLGAISKAVSNIPYGTSPIGEQTFRMKIEGTSFLRGLAKQIDYEVTPSLTNNLIQSGISKADADRVAGRVAEALKNGRSAEIGNILRDELSAAGIHPTLAEMGVPYEAVSNKTMIILDDILGQHARGEMDDAIAHANLDGAFGLERNELGRLMNQVPPSQFNPRDIEAENLLKEAGMIGDVSRRAGATPAQAQQETADFIRRRSQVADESVQRFMQTWGEGDFTPGAFNTALDYWADITEATRRTRIEVDRINRLELDKAVDARDWGAVKQQVDSLYKKLDEQYKLITDKHRLNLQGVRAGKPSVSKTDWWTMAQTRATYDPERYQALVTGKATGNAEALAKELIDQTRARTDASLIDMFDVWRKAPTADNFGLMTSAFRRYLKQGAQLEAEVARLPNPGTAGYQKAKTYLWKQFADLQEAQNIATSKIMVMNYLKQNAQPSLTWSRPLQRAAGGLGQAAQAIPPAAVPSPATAQMASSPPQGAMGARTYTLDMPMGNGVYRATEQGTGTVRYFKAPGATVPKSFTKPITGEVPQPVLDKFDALLKNTRAAGKIDNPVPATLKAGAKPPAGVRPWYKQMGMDTYDPKKNPLQQIFDWFSGDYASSKSGRPVDTIGDMADHMADQLDVTYHTLVNSLYDPAKRQVYKPIDPSAQLAVQDAVADALKTYEKGVWVARKSAEDITNWAMMDFGNQRNIDAWLQVLMPFSYYWSRMWSRGAEAALTKPALMNFYYDAKRGVQRENLQAGVPKRLEGTIPNPLYVAANAINPEWANGPAQEGLTSLLFNERMRNPIDAMINPWSGYFPSPFVDLDEETTTMGNPLYQMANLVNPEWANGPAQQGMASGLFNPEINPGKGFAAFQKYTGFSVYPGWELALAGIAALNGDKSKINDWSMGSQLWPLQALYYGYVAATGNLDSKVGYNAPWWGRAGDQWDLGRVGRELTNSLVEGKVSPELAKWGNDIGYQIQNEVGPLPEQPDKARSIWEAAAQRMGINRLSAIFGSTMLGLGIYDYPASEKQTKAITTGYNALGADTNVLGSKAAMQGFGAQANGLPDGVNNKDVVDVSRMGSGRYPSMASDTPVPPQINFRQPYEPKRPGVIASDIGASKIYDEYAAKIADADARADEAFATNDNQKGYDFIDERNRLYDERDALLEENFPSRTQKGTDEYKARQDAKNEIYDKYDKLIGAAADKKDWPTYHSLKDDKAAALAANEAQYPGAVNSSEIDFDALRAETERSNEIDLSPGWVPPLTEGVGGDWRPPMALTEDGQIPPDKDNNFRLDPMRQSLVEGQADVFRNMSTDEKRQALLDQAKDMAEQEQDRDGMRGDEEDLVNRITDIVNDLGLASALVPGAGKPSTTAIAAQQLALAYDTLGMPMPPYNELVYWADLAAAMPKAPGEYTPEDVAEALDLPYNAPKSGGGGGGGGGGGSGGGGRRYYSSRRRSSYRRGGGGGGGGGRSSGRRYGGGGGSLGMGTPTVPPATVSMPRLNDFDRSLYPGNGEVPVYYVQRYPRDWMSAGQKLRPDKLSKWRAPA